MASASQVKSQTPQLWTCPSNRQSKDQSHKLGLFLIINNTLGPSKDQFKDQLRTDSLHLHVTKSIITYLLTNTFQNVLNLETKKPAITTSTVLTKEVSKSQIQNVKIDEIGVKIDLRTRPTQKTRLERLRRRLKNLKRKKLPKQCKRPNHQLHQNQSKPRPPTTAMNQWPQWLVQY